MNDLVLKADGNTTFSAAPELGSLLLLGLPHQCGRPYLAGSTKSMPESSPISLLWLGAIDGGKLQIHQLIFT